MASTLSVVRVSWECVTAMIGHALTTDREEVMGLLIGDVDEGVARVVGTHQLPRSDQKSDRVEISAEDLAAAALRFSTSGARVVGWYHSHPHITSEPSHVDVRTQASYQLMDRGFVGLILACFSKEGFTLGGPGVASRITAFQSEPGPDGALERTWPTLILGDPTLPAAPPEASPWVCLAQLQRILAGEEREAYARALGVLAASGSTSVVTDMHHASLFSATLCKILELSAQPLATVLETRRAAVKNELARLRKELDLMQDDEEKEKKL
jgi:BRCA1/BRCA2-containing complex subunit 3